MCGGMCGLCVYNSNFLQVLRNQKHWGKEIIVFSGNVCVHFIIQKIKHNIYSREVYIWALSF